MSSGERAALLATSSRVDGDGGTFATATERDVDVEVAGSDGVGASSTRSSAWRRRSYLWLTIASTLTFAIIMAIVAYGVSSSKALAEGGLPTSAGETRATLGGRERDVEEDSYEDEAALGAGERRTRRRKERREDAFARAYVERHARGSEDEPTREERLASERAAEAAEDAVLDAREARRQKRVATRAAARVESAREAASEEAKETRAETSSLSRAAASAGDDAAREARREQHRATREAARAVEEKKEARDAKEATVTRVAATDTGRAKSTEEDDSEEVSPREVRRERRRAERIAKRMVANRLGDDEDDEDNDDEDRSSSREKALKRQAKREQQEDAEKSTGRAAERQHKRDVEKASNKKIDDRKRRDKRDDDDEKKDARSKRNDEASERQEKREKLQEQREEIQRKAESKKREAEERQEEREKDREEDEKDREKDAKKRQDDRDEKREEIQRKAQEKKEEAEKREKERKEKLEDKAEEEKEEAEKREKERKEKLEDKAEEEKKGIEEAKEEGDEKLDKLKRRAEAKKRELEELKKEEVKNRKNSRESADLGEATKDAIFLTYSDHVTGGLCASAETAAMNDIDLQMLGAQGPSDPFTFPDVKNVKTKKVFAFLRALTDEVWRNKFGIGDDTIVSVGDATDVLYFKHRSEMIRAFEEIEAESKVGDGKLVVVSSERNCWPWMIHGKERLPKGKDICASFPDAPSSYKYLNSGSLMGRAKGLAALLRDVVERMQSVNEDDQLILANAFLRQSAAKTSPIDSPYIIKLDHMQRLFQTAYNGQLESPNFAQYRAKDAYYDRAHTQVVNTETNMTPVIVHFNGLKANLFRIARHFMVHHGHAEKYAQIKQSWLQPYPFFNATCQHIVENIKIGIMPPMLKPTHTITDIERKRLVEER